MITAETTPTETQQHRNQLEERLDDQTAKLTAVNESAQQKIAQYEQVDNELQEHREQIGSDTKKSEIEMAGLADVSEERAGILAIVKGLEVQVDTLSMLKEISEFEFDATEKILSEESAARDQLELQVNVLETQVDQLQKDMSSFKEEWKKFANFISEKSQEFETVNK